MINNDKIGVESVKKFSKLTLRLDPDAKFPNSIESMVTGKSTRRYHSQQALFTVSDNPLADQEAAIEALDIGTNSAYKIIIPKELKLELLQKLRSVNIKADILYPDAFGFGKELSNLAIIRTTEIDTKNFD